MYHFPCAALKSPMLSIHRCHSRKERTTPGNVRAPGLNHHGESISATTTSQPGHTWKSDQLNGMCDVQWKRTFMHAISKPRQMCDCAYRE